MKRFVSLAGALLVGTVVAEPEPKVTSALQNVNHGERQVRMADRQYNQNGLEQAQRGQNKAARYQSHATSNTSDDEVAEVQVQYRNFDDLVEKPRRQVSQEEKSYQRLAPVRSDSISSWDKEEQAYKLEVQARQANRASSTDNTATVPVRKYRVANQRADSPRSWDSNGRSFSANQSSASATSHDDEDEIIEVQRSMVGSLDYNIRPAEKRSSSPAEWDELNVEQVYRITPRPTSFNNDHGAYDYTVHFPNVESGRIGGDGHDNWRHNTQQPVIGGGDHDQWWKYRNQGQQQPVIGGGDHDQWWKHRQQPQAVPYVESGRIGGDGHDNWRRNQPVIGGGDHDQWWKYRQQQGVPQVSTILGGPTDPDHYRATQLIGGGDHDYSWRQPRVEAPQDIYLYRGGPLVESGRIGGDGHDNWRRPQPVIGGGDHDQWWKNRQQQAAPQVNSIMQDIVESEPARLARLGIMYKGPAYYQQFENAPLVEKKLIGGDGHDNWQQYRRDRQYQPVIGGGDHDQWWKHRQQRDELQVEGGLIGGGTHDYWRQATPQVESRLIGGDGHDNWQQYRQNQQVNRQPIIGGGDHDNWQKHRNGQNIYVVPYNY